MFPRRFFPGRYFATTFWPQSQGEAPPAPPAGFLDMDVEALGLLPRLAWGS